MKRLILLSIMGIVALTMNAQLLYNETFNYTTTKLASVANDPNTSATNNTLGVWYNTGKATDSNSSSFLLSDPIYFTNYITSGIGKSVVIDYAGAGTNTRIDVVRFLPYASKLVGPGGTGTANYTGNLYYSFMLSVTNAGSYATTTSTEGTDWRDIFLICEGGTEVLGNALRGRFFIKQDPTDPYTIHYSISKNTSFSSSLVPTNEGTFPAGQVCLFVIRQSFTTSPSATGTVEVILNPAISSIEPTTGWINGYPSDSNPFTGTYGIGIRRRNLASTANIQIGGVRVAKTWSDVLLGTLSGISQIERNSTNITATGNTIVTTESGSLKVYNLAGKEVLSAKTDGKLSTSLSKGLYLVRFVGTEGIVKSAKVQIN